MEQSACSDKNSDAHSLVFAKHNMEQSACSDNKTNEGGGSGSGDNRAPEFQPHPVKEQLPGVQYCVNSPAPWRSYILFYFHSL